MKTNNQIKAYVSYIYNGVKETRFVEGSSFELENYLERLSGNRSISAIKVRYS